MMYAVYRIPYIAWSLAGEEGVAYSLARGKAAAVTRESGEVAVCSLARERRRRQSLAPGPLRNKEKTREPFLSRSSCLQLAGLDSMRGARAQKITSVLTINWASGSEPT